MLDLCLIYVGFMLDLCWIYVGFKLSQTYKQVVTRHCLFQVVGASLEQPVKNL